MMQGFHNQVLFFPLTFFVLAGVLSMTSGCGKKPAPELTPEERIAEEDRLNREVEETMMSVSRAEAEGRIEDAMKILDTAFTNPRFASVKSRFFSQKIYMLLSKGKEEEAETLILDAWKNERECARSVFGSIHNHYQQKKETALDLAWCEKLSAPGIKLPPELFPTLLSWRLSSTIQGGDAQVVSALVATIAGQVKEAEGVKIFSDTLGQLTNSENADFLEKILNAGKSFKELNTKAYQNLFLMLKTRGILAKRLWNELGAVYNEALVALPDDDLFVLMREVFTDLKKNRQKVLLEKLAEDALAKTKEKNRSLYCAVKSWIACCLPDRATLLPARFEKLIADGFSPLELGALYERYFYELYHDHVMLKKMCDVGERLVTMCKDSNTVHAITIKLLDGAFITDDYPRAIEMLKKGIPGKDTEWHSMTIPKVEAHYQLQLAEKEKDFAKKSALLESAIAKFRVFMDVWKKTPQEEEYDPTSGIAYCKEWILGRNADRIAKLYREINKSAEADAAGREAKAYFEQALKKTSGDSEALKLLKIDTKPYGI